MKNSVENEIEASFPGVRRVADHENDAFSTMFDPSHGSELPGLRLSSKSGNVPNQGAVTEMKIITS